MYYVRLTGELPANERGLRARSLPSRWSVLCGRSGWGNPSNRV